MKNATTSLIAALTICLLAGQALGVAAQSDDPMAPSFFNGDAGLGWRAWDESTETSPAGTTTETGSSSVLWQTNDPRINGVATSSGSTVRYEEDALIESSLQDGSMWGQLTRVENADGAWEGTLDLLEIEEVELSIKSGWLVGEGAYEGLLAYVVVDYSDHRPDETSLMGHITPDGQPSVPETIPER